MANVFKQKKEIMECSSHRWIKLRERVVDESLREIVNLGKQQYGFIRGTDDAVNIIR